MNSKNRLPHSIPFGWYCVAYSDELAKGEIKTLDYFEREMVLFRTESGDLSLLDPYCPHLGAHLGVGGEVVGESIRCPFHHWSFDKNYICTDIPYAKQIPPKAQKTCNKVYHVVEKNKVIWAWYHPEDKAPWFEVMDTPEVNDPEWVDLKRFEWQVRTNVQEIAENGVDVAHFKYIHGMEAVPEGETTYDGHVRESKAWGEREIPQEDGSMKKVESKVHTIQNGAGQKYTRISGLSETLLQVLVTPINKELVDLRFAFTHKDFPEDSMEYKVAQAAIESTCGKKGVVGDIPVWDNKIHRTDPILCDGDGPIMQFRKYFAQFYIDLDKPGKEEAA